MMKEAKVKVNCGIFAKTHLRAGELTVYGTESCPWCKKQREYLDSKAMSYTFVDCQTQECPGVDAYPTLDNNGEILVGYHQL
ncbi:MAG: hypothetical protein DRR19_13445 [Candidatus Parabeggiatoa sp. nov. 1]|nr:MAG: hypothetical protein DRR19_13445 [Gammaproteobacteria bacterium]